ncbi:MAG: hypothetical protein E7672_08060 [Ruminococcaceae bacterium]|nr:hypothetical protein [Oscillospiraceae bacterium]
MKNKTLKRIITASLSALMVSGVCMNVSAGNGSTDATVKSYEEQLQAIKNKQQEALKKLEQVRNQQTTAYTEMGTLDELIKYNTELKNLAEGQLDTIELQIAEKKAAILETEEDIAKQEEAFLERMVQIYMDDTTDYIELILGSESLVDFLSRIEKINAIFEYDEKLIDTLETNKKYLELERENLAAAEETQLIRVSELEKAIKDNQEIYEEKLNYVSYLESNETLWLNEYNYNKQLEDQKNKELEEYLAELQKKTQSQYVGGAIGWPLEAGAYYRVSSPYGWRTIFGVREFHLGIDLAAYYGTKVLSANSGTVLVSEEHYSYGNYILIDHGGGISTLYAHLSERLVKVGDTVSPGQLIGYVGLTGRTTGAHLHFETRVNGKTDDPENHLIFP